MLTIIGIIVIGTITGIILEVIPNDDHGFRLSTAIILSILIAMFAVLGYKSYLVENVEIRPLNKNLTIKQHEKMIEKNREIIDNFGEKKND